MALIKNINETNSLSLNDKHSPVLLNLNDRTFKWQDNYVISVAGDNNSQTITFEFDREYDGVDIYGTTCILTYWTSWTDDSPEQKHSKGQIIMDLKEVEDKLQCEWVLDQYQTAKAGQCLFTLTFYLNLDEDYYYGPYTNAYPKEINGVWKIYDETTDIYHNFAYYSLSSTAGQFTVVNDGLGEGGRIELSQPELGVGRTTSNGGEIFNDYQNNKALSVYSTAFGTSTTAGARGYHIVDLKKYDNYAVLELEDNHLNSKAIDEYEIGYKVNLEIQYHFSECYEILNVYTNEETGNTMIDIEPVSKEPWNSAPYTMEGLF